MARDARQLQGTARPFSTTALAAALAILFTQGVWSRHLMEWIEDESFRLFCPCLADEFVGCEAFECLESPAEV